MGLILSSLYLCIYFIYSVFKPFFFSFAWLSDEDKVDKRTATCSFVSQWLAVL